MTASLRGPHHFYGIANAVTEMIFRHLQSVCESGGGSLSPADLETARTHTLRSYPGAFSFFEASHDRCMEACAASAPALFARDAILATLLMACGHKAARPAFPSQMTRFGEVWLGQLFGGVAAYVRQRINAEVDDRLMPVYAELCAKRGAKLTMDHLLGDGRIRALIEDCVSRMVEETDTASRLSDIASQYIAAARGIPKPDLSKITEQETRNFLTWLPRQVHVALTASGTANGATH